MARASVTIRCLRVWNCQTKKSFLCKISLVLPTLGRLETVAPSSSNNSWLPLALVVINAGHAKEESCNLVPLGINTQPLPADNRFAIEIVGVQDFKYIPNRSYTVRLYSREPQYTFIAFTIAATGDQKYNEKNPRRPIPLSSGRVVGYNDSQTTSKEICPNTVFQSDVTPKSEVKIIWIAPQKDNKCVTLIAYVAVKPDVWYKPEGPLSQKVCEDRRQDDDMPPPENNDCSVCEDARYELIFEGSWSYNTHPQMFPEHHDLAKFSDIVGASHSKNFYVFRKNSEATEGLKMLAEQGNTTKLEMEISEELDSNVRTIIKATGPPKPDMSTISSFRASKDQHYISIVSAIIPSPDWFLGVPKLELCTSDNKWAEHVKLNLYPLDAGTDSGSNFESPNEETSPPKPVGEAAISQNMPREEIKPFATIRLKLIRTYTTPYCDNEVATEATGEETGVDTDTAYEEPNQYPSGTVVGPGLNSNNNSGNDDDNPRIDHSIKDCAITLWDEWLPCEGECIDHVIKGYRTRFRYFYVNGQEVGRKFDDDDENAVTPSEYCFNKYATSDIEKCEGDPCADTTEESATEIAVAV